MNWDQVQAQWKQVEAQLKSKWAKLTDDDMKHLGAKKDMLVGKIQERYGVLKEEAERQVDEWLQKLSVRSDAQAKSSPGAHRENQPKDRSPKHF
jgi:uncharacterized protein YjbJ (UPF0337 family)